VTQQVAVEHRGDETDAAGSNTEPGWARVVEAIEGATALASCIAESGRSPFTETGISLAAYRPELLGAPIFGIDGRLMAVLDVSAIDPERSERAHALTGALPTTSARAIEERFFRERFRHEWVVAVSPPEGGAAGMLMAVDGNQRIVGANRTARTSLVLDDYRLRIGASLWTVFERDPALFRRKDATDIPTQLARRGQRETWPALVTPPEARRAVWQQARSDALHTRPRLERSLP
jgi:transcriptional regulator of acetoin/glycerol metabolism